MDLRTLDTKAGAEAGFDVPLRHPSTGKLLDGMTIRVHGADADIYRDSMIARQRARLERQARNPGVMPALDVIDNMHDEARALLVAITIGWQGIELDGAPVVFSREACDRVYRDFSWVREQVDAAVHDRANFLPGSASNS